MEMNVVGGVGRGSPSEAGCNCLPACKSLEYAVDEDRADYQWQMSVRAWRANESEYFQG